ncbi:MAG: nucleoside deaminase [Candidatus Absconditabacteria bacterium]|nr:nucleoside deaminase [Candidatus Absconditabacteria bacterium]
MNQEFMREAIRLSQENMEKNAGGPFGAVIVKDGKIVGKGRNKVTSTNDPTAHAEMVAIRDACQNLKTFELNGCELYTSCEPCPMCLGAIYWARFDKVYYGNTKEDAADINFDDQYIYEELDRPLDKRNLPMQKLLREEAIKVFQKWAEKEDKVLY